MRPRHQNVKVKIRLKPFIFGVNFVNDLAQEGKQGTLPPGKVIPIFNAGSKTEANNYRLVSLLLNFSKILKKLTYTRHLKFLEKNKVNHPNQYAF